MSDNPRKNMVPLTRLTGLRTLVRFAPRPPVFPFYHVVSDAYLPHIRPLYAYRSVPEFEEDLDAMLDVFEPMELSQYLLVQGDRKETAAGRASRNVKGKRAMVLSFDDGLAECHGIVAPILKRKGIPAVFFLNNQFIDNKGLFYRYKVGIILDAIGSSDPVRRKVAIYLAVPPEQLEHALNMLGHRQRPLIDAVAAECGVDFKEYLVRHPVYMSSQQVRDLLSWGFEIGAHGADHRNLNLVPGAELEVHIRSGIDDLIRRFGIQTRYFSFPFTTFGIPGKVLRQLLERRAAEALLGTAGLKQTGNPAYVQRIPMEDLDNLPASTVLKAEYLYYLLKTPLGRNRLPD